MLNSCEERCSQKVVHGGGGEKGACETEKASPVFLPALHLCLNRIPSVPAPRFGAVYASCALHRISHRGAAWPDMGCLDRRGVCLVRGYQLAAMS